MAHEYYVRSYVADPDNLGEVFSYKFVQEVIVGIAPLKIELSKPRMLTAHGTSNTRKYVRYVKLTLTNEDFMLLKLKGKESADDLIILDMDYYEI
jgi:hypothetical protein